MESPILEIENLHKSYQTGSLSQPPVEVLSGIDLSLPRGETAAIIGQSGSGKSTFLSLLAGLDHADKGHIRISGFDILSASEKELALFRGQHIGIIFQGFYLMPHLNALENVNLPLELNKNVQKQRGASSVLRPEDLLDQVGLGHRKTHFPHQLSGGECQRVAIARAMVTNPSLILADEPSGNLDESTGDQVMDLLFELVEKNNSSLVLVTHNQALAKKCHKTYKLERGQLTCSP